MKVAYYGFEESEDPSKIIEAIRHKLDGIILEHGEEIEVRPLKRKSHNWRRVRYELRGWPRVEGSIVDRDGVHTVKEFESRGDGWEYKRHKI